MEKPKRIIVDMDCVWLVSSQQNYYGYEIRNPNAPEGSQIIVTGGTYSIHDIFQLISNILQRGDE